MKKSKTLKLKYKRETLNPHVCDQIIKQKTLILLNEAGYSPCREDWPRDLTFDLYNGYFVAKMILIHPLYLILKLYYVKDTKNLRLCVIIKNRTLSLIKNTEHNYIKNTCYSFNLSMDHTENFILEKYDTQDNWSPKDYYDSFLYINLFI